MHKGTAVRRELHVLDPKATMPCSAASCSKGFELSWDGTQTASCIVLGT